MRDQKTEYPPIEGLTEALRLSRTPRAFEECCKRALAWALRATSLRQACRETGFLPVSFREYLEALAQQTPVDVPGILEAFGIDRLTSAKEASQVARLARGIGMTLRQLLVHIGIGVAEEYGVPALAMGRSRKAGHGTHSLEACEAALRAVAWEPEAAAMLRTLEQAAAARYDED